MAEKSDEGLLLEAQQASYTERSRFLLRKLRESGFQEWIKRVNVLEPGDYDWLNLEEFGISQRAWEYVEDRGNSACRVFCHPAILINDPPLIGYYRGIAGLSAKGMQSLAFSTVNIEAGRSPLPKEKAEKAARVLNQITSAIIESDAEYSVADAILLLHTTVGISIDGSWRNAIGVQAAKQVKRMIVEHFANKGEIIAFLAKDGQELSKPVPTDIDKIGGFVLTNGYTVLFGSEPDARTVSPAGKVTGVIEIKGGLDPAGALERYGAAKKSFDEALDQDKATRTMYLAACITPTLFERINRDKAVHTVFNLTNVLLEEEERRKFLSEMEWWVAK